MPQTRNQRRQIVIESDDEFDYDMDNNRDLENFVVGDDFIEYDDDISVLAETSSTTVQPTSLLQRFREAMSKPNDLRTESYYYDIIFAKLKPALIRGHKTNQEKFDKLVAFVQSEQLTQSDLIPTMKSHTCDLCEIKRDISKVISNGKEHYVVGACCAQHILSARGMLEKLADAHREILTFTEQKFNEINDITDGIIESNYRRRLSH